MRRHVDPKGCMLPNHGCRRISRRTIGDEFRLVSKTLSVCRKSQIFHDFRFVFGTFRDNPSVQVKNLPVPKHFNRLLFFSDQTEKTPIIGRTDDDFTVCQELWSLGTLCPPNYIIFDGVKFRKSPVLSGRCSKYIINF